MDLQPSSYEVSTYRRQGYLVEGLLLDSARSHCWGDQMLIAADAVPRRPAYADGGGGVAVAVAVAESAHPMRGACDLDEWAQLIGLVANDAGVLTWVTALLGRPAQLSSAVARLQPSDHTGGELWRQESALCSPRPSRMVCVWLAMDDETEESGCLVVLPRSHQQGLLHHTRYQGQWCADLSRPAAVLRSGGGHAVSLPAGGAVFYDGLLLTAALPGSPSARQRALQLNFVPLGEEPQPRR